MAIKLPTNDKDRKDTINDAIKKAIMDAVNGVIYIDPDTVTAGSTLLSEFETVFNRKEAKFELRMTKNATQSKLFDKLKTYGVDTAKSAKMRIIRNEEPLSLLHNYGMTQEGKIPNPQSMDDKVKLVQDQIRGNAEAVAQGFATTTNPTIVESQAVLAETLAAQAEASQAETDYDTVQAELAVLRIKIIELIDEFVDQLEFALRKLEDPSVRRIMRTYGFKFESEPGEELPGQAVNFGYVFEHPQLIFTCDALPDVTGYIAEYSTDNENWHSLYEGAEPSFKY
ncbi:MAG: hypothetical protein H8E57_09825, partial [Candidatus Cloacimonetes bacterium]|nr:hypothetical protein [Candidatus Cloacimonadota bacterium]